MFYRAAGVASRLIIFKIAVGPILVDVVSLHDLRRWCGQAPLQ
jgi:hypothetical protein